MSTIAIIGAGRGVGAHVARRFGSEGFDIILVSRNQAHVDELAEELKAEGLNARGYQANVRDAAGLAATLDRAAGEMGMIEVLVYQPLPQREFLRPVLETTPADAQAAFEFSVMGPIAAVHQVKQAMKFAGGGTILFVNGGTAVESLAKFAGTSVAFAGQSALAEMLHETLAEDGTYVGQLIIPGGISADHPKKKPSEIARHLWEMHVERGEMRRFVMGMHDADV